MKDNKSASGARRLASHASIYATGNILRQLAGFIMLPIYTRYLTPADYGVVGLMTFAISLIELFFGARLGQAIPKFYFEEKDEQARAKLVSTAMIITGSISSITTLVVIFFRKSFSLTIFGSQSYATIVGFFSVLILTQALEYYALVYLRLKQRPWLFVSLNLTKLLLQLTLNIWLVVFKALGVMGIAISAMTSSSIFVLLLMVYTLREVGFRFDRIMTKKMIRFCWPLWLAGFAGLYIGSANRYYLRLFSSMDDIGFFELAMKFSTITTLLIWEPFAQYWQVERFRYYQQGNAEHIFQDVFLFISTLLVLAALAISIFSGPVIRIMSDEAFHKAAMSVPFVVFGSVFGSLIIFSNFCFLVKENTIWISRNNYLEALVITIFYFALIPTAGHVGAALSFLIGHAFHFLIVHYSGRRFYDMGISLKPLAVALIVSAVACWISNEITYRDNLIEDIAVKLVVYLVACAFIIWPIWRNCSSNRFLLDLLSVLFLKAKNR